MKNLFRLILGVFVALSLTACSKDAPAVTAPVGAATSTPKTTSAPEVAICVDCGTVSSITTIDLSTKTSGAGAALGAVLGGVLGSQVGAGKGTDAAIVVGAVGGAILGQGIESRRNANTAYDVYVKMDDGSFKIFRVAEFGSLHTGQLVRVSGSTILPRE